MNSITSLLFDNEILEAEIEAFCANDPKYLQTMQQFEKAAEEIAKHVGHDLYNTFEKSFNMYLYRTADLYYLFGLGLRQDLLQAMGAD